MCENAAPGGCAARADVGIGPYSKDESQSVRRKRFGSAATRTRNARDLRRDCELVRSPQTLRRGRCGHRPLQQGRKSVRSPQALWQRGHADAQCAPLRRDCELVRSPQTLRRGRCLHRPEPAAGGSLPRRRSGSGYLSGSLNACDSVVGAAISRPELAAFGGSPPGSRSGKRAAISRPYDVAGSWCVRQRPSGIAAMRARDARDPRRESDARRRKRRPIPLYISCRVFFISQNTAPPPWAWEAARHLLSLHRTQ